VFHRLVDDGQITARLTVIHRQTEASGIPAVAAAIRDGRMLDLPKYAGPADGASLVECNPAAIAGSIDGIWAELQQVGLEPLIVTATNDGDAGIHALNARFHNRHVGQAELLPMKGYLGQWFAIGDPVVFLRNDYARGLFNGLLGRIVRIDHEARACAVQFEGYDEPHELGPDDLIDLALAYAITCHRAQGSQAPAVIVPIYESRVVDPSWLYTAITRAEQQVVLVGARSALADALRRPRSARRRQVGLRWSFAARPADAA
jgi:exodeoxyribonuclease V alpha subunit